MQYYGTARHSAVAAVASAGMSYRGRCRCGTPACELAKHSLYNKVIAAKAWLKEEAKHA